MNDQGDRNPAVHRDKFWQKLSQNSDYNFEDYYGSYNGSPQRTAEMGHILLGHVENHRIRENMGSFLLLPGV